MEPEHHYSAMVKVLVGAIIILLSSTTVGGFMAWRELAVVSTKVENIEQRMERYDRRMEHLERRAHPAVWTWEDEFYVARPKY